MKLLLLVKEKMTELIKSLLPVNTKSTKTKPGKNQTATFPAKEPFAWPRRSPLAATAAARLRVRLTLGALRAFLTTLCLPSNWGFGGLVEGLPIHPLEPGVQIRIQTIHQKKQLKNLKNSTLNKNTHWTVGQQGPPSCWASMWSCQRRPAVFVFERTFFWGVS